jgi:hypothetical protein
VLIIASVLRRVIETMAIEEPGHVNDLTYDSFAKGCHTLVLIPERISVGVNIQMID